MLKGFSKNHKPFGPDIVWRCPFKTCSTQPRIVHVRLVLTRENTPHGSIDITILQVQGKLPSTLSALEWIILYRQTEKSTKQLHFLQVRSHQENKAAAFWFCFKRQLANSLAWTFPDNNLLCYHMDSVASYIVQVWAKLFGHSHSNIQACWWMTVGFILRVHVWKKAVVLCSYRATEEIWKSHFWRANQCHPVVDSFF